MIPEIRLVKEASTEDSEEKEYWKFKKQGPEHETKGK